ncbi:MAG: hypothetical protein K5685_13615 [Bacteroidales bacterium]|nr:hypothetical protein [Bacteroidales bacterium]
MKINKIFLYSLMAAGILSACQKTELYDVNEPNWVLGKIDSIAAVKAAEQQGGEEVIEGLMEDVYDIGTADFTAPFFTVGKTYLVPAEGIWKAQFNLTVNPDNKYYKNFFLVLNAVNGESLGDEYGVIRFDNDPSKNSEWNTTGTAIDRSLVDGNFKNSSESDDIDASVQKMNGKITVTVDRTNGGLFIEMTNGTLTKTYKQTTAFPDANGATAALGLRVGVEGSFVNFLGTTIEPIGGCTSAADKQPVSMVLNNVPKVVPIAENLDVNEIMKGVTATVTFEEGVTKEYTAEDLVFMTIPDLTKSGDKQLIAAFSQSFKGEAAKPVMATVNFKIVDFSTIKINDIAYSFNPKFFGEDSKISLPKSQLTVFGVDAEGKETPFSSDLIADLKVDEVSTKEGEYEIKGDWNGLQTTFKVTMTKADVVDFAGQTSGLEDKTGGWYNETLMSESYKVEAGKSAAFTFTNYGGAADWSNFVVALTEAAKIAGSGTAGIFSNEWGCVVPSNLNKWGSGATAALAIESNLPTWTQELWNGVKVSVVVTNNGGTSANIVCNFALTDGNTYQVSYTNFTIGGDLYITIAADSAYLKFE